MQCVMLFEKNNKPRLVVQKVALSSQSESPSHARRVYQDISTVRDYLFQETQVLAYKPEIKSSGFTKSSSKLATPVSDLHYSTGQIVLKASSLC